MSNLTDGLHAHIVTGSVYPGELVLLRKLYDTYTYYGRPQKREDVPMEGPPTMQQTPHNLGDEGHMDIHKALHSLLSGKLEMVETRKLLVDRQRRG